jgi:hypothetical protein
LKDRQSIEKTEEMLQDDDLQDDIQRLTNAVGINYW